MFVDNAAITQDQDQNNGFYTANEENPSGGECGERDGARNLAFIITGSNSMRAIFGITLCPDLFNQPTTSSLGSPNVNSGTKEIDRFMDTGGMGILHEMVPLVSLNCKKPYPALCERYSRTNLSHIVIQDQSAVYPPKGKSWKNRYFAKWTLDPTELSYGYSPVAYLGLAAPKLAMINTDSYTVLGVCRQNPELDCLGKFQKDIIAKRKLPFQVSPRAVQKIRSGELDLKKDDVPTDSSMNPYDCPHSPTIHRGSVLVAP